MRTCLRSHCATLKSYTTYGAAPRKNSTTSETPATFTEQTLQLIPPGYLDWTSTEVSLVVSLVRPKKSSSLAGGDLLEEIGQCDQFLLDSAVAHRRGDLDKSSENGEGIQ